MKPQFEIHEGQLFLMLEEPVPLTTDAKLPRVVRLIQDDSRMGMFNRDTKPSRLSDFYLAARIVNNNIIVDEFMESDYHRFEIIGYPVDEGSAEWALYQMMQGKWVYNPSLEKHKSDKLDTRYLHAYGKFGQDIVVKNTLTGIDSILGAANISHWTNYAEPSGWQIYKEPEHPKPLLADAQVGDLCEHRNGDWSQIIDTNGTYIQGQPIRTTLKDTKGINRNFCLSGSHFTMQFGGEYDIIHTEPLAPEGSAEWAGQMLKLGKMVKHENNIYPHSLDVDGKVYYCHEHRESQGLLQEWIIGRGAKTGWQLYEPKPQYKVGDCRIEFVKKELYNLLDKL
jgi:hypothetical protein